jgi:hypothetical protein
VHSWENSTGMQLTYRIEQTFRRRGDAGPPDCARGQLTMDARPIANGAFQDLVMRVPDVEFCRDTSGRWSIENSWAR